MTTAHPVWIAVYGSDAPSSVQQRLELAVAAFCERSGIPLPPAEMLVTARTDRGKPYFPLAPQFHFSISHSGGIWV